MDGQIILAIRGEQSSVAGAARATKWWRRHTTISDARSGFAGQHKD